MQGVNLAKLNYLFQNFLSYLFPVRLSQQGNSWRSGRIKGKQKSFCNVHIFLYLHLQLLHLPRNLLQLVCFLDQVCVFNFTAKDPGFCRTPTASRSEAAAADMGFSLSSLGSGSYLWVLACFSSSTLQQPSLLTVCSVYFEV